MQRLLLKQLLEWKDRPQRKPVLIDGVRHVGKSYLVEELFAREFQQVVKLNFLEDSEVAELFNGSLTPDLLIESIERYLDLSFNPETDLLFFDEIDECQRAVDSLKFFCEQRSDLFVCASSSKIGLLSSYPVGKVHQVDLNPMCFEEFLEASGNDRLLQRFRDRDLSPAVQSKIWDMLLDYYFVGGLPKAVKAWFSRGSKLERVRLVRQIHEDLVRDYIDEFGKGDSYVHPKHIEIVFKSVPTQLGSNENNRSVKRYRFKDVIPKKAGYRELNGPINWLEKAHFLSKCYLLDKPISPFAINAKDSRFKLFFFDVGLLNYLLDLSYRDVRDQNGYYRGFLAENFVHNELRREVYPSYSWAENTAEIAFLYKTTQGEVVPVEVTNGRNSKAKALKSFCDRYSPVQAVKLLSSPDSRVNEHHHLEWPVYYAGQLRALLELAGGKKLSD